MRYAWTINQRDGGGPFVIGESEDRWFDSIEEAVEDAKGVWQDYDGPEFIQVFEEPATSYDLLVAGWSPKLGLQIWG